MTCRVPRIIWCFLAAGLALRLLVIQWTAGIELILDEAEKGNAETRWNFTFDVSDGTVVAETDGD